MKRLSFFKFIPKNGGNCDYAYHLTVAFGADRWRSPRWMKRWAELSFIRSDFISPKTMTNTLTLLLVSLKIEVCLSRSLTKAEIAEQFEMRNGVVSR